MPYLPWKELNYKFKYEQFIHLNSKYIWEKSNSCMHAIAIIFKIIYKLSDSVRFAFDILCLFIYYLYIKEIITYMGSEIEYNTNSLNIPLNGIFLEEIVNLSEFRIWNILFLLYGFFQPSCKINLNLFALNHFLMQLKTTPWKYY